jgi:hypothetical protein
MIAAVIAASSAREWYWLYLRLLGSRDGIRLSKGGIHLILCLALLRVF